MNKILHGEAESIPYPDDHFDCLVTDPPYGYGFMGKDWDKAVVGVKTWKEILRVMKPGAFGFIMSAPRQDVLSRMIVNLQDAGFETGFTSIYWAYATGFPKASNISKAVDKRLGVEREVVGVKKNTYDGAHRNPEKHGNPADQSNIGKWGLTQTPHGMPETAPTSPLAKTLDGAYAGFQPKPAVEVILVVMKPLSEKSYLDQAMKDGKGVTWLEAGRIPTGENLSGGAYSKDGRARPMTGDIREGAALGMFQSGAKPDSGFDQPQGRFPANLLVSDDVLDDGRVTKSAGGVNEGKLGQRVYGDFENRTPGRNAGGCGDTGTFSRYFDLDSWWEALPESVRKTFPFLICPKASKAEKNRGCEALEKKRGQYRPNDPDENSLRTRLHGSIAGKNSHPTVKPIKLMSYLIAIGSRPGDIILDPFMGSGTTLVAAKVMGRPAVGIDNDPECVPVAEGRVKVVNKGLF